MSRLSFSYITAYKIATRYTPYQLVYGLHSLMPIEYIVPIVSGHQRESTSTKVLTIRVSKLEKLQGARMQTVETNGIQQWNRALGS